MDDKIKDRVAEYSRTCGISVAEFARTIGVSKTYFYKVKGEFGITIVNNIRKHYPNLNITWLSTGEGAMLLPETPKSDTGALNNPKSYDLSNEDEITRLRGEVEYLKGQIIARDEEISFYRRTITEALTSTKKGE